MYIGVYEGVSCIPAGGIGKKLSASLWPLSKLSQPADSIMAGVFTRTEPSHHDLFLNLARAYRQHHGLILKPERTAA